MSDEDHLHEAQKAASRVWSGDDEWVQTLGLYVLRFSSIEYVTFWLIQAFGPDEATKSVLRYLEFSKRTARCKELISAAIKPHNRELSAAWSAFLDKARQAGDDRNAVLHNPLQLAVYVSDDGAYAFEQHIRPMRRDDVPAIKLDTVKAQLERLINLSDEAMALLLRTGPFLQKRRGS